MARATTAPPLWWSVVRVTVGGRRRGVARAPAQAVGDEQDGPPDGDEHEGGGQHADGAGGGQDADGQGRVQHHQAWSHRPVDAGVASSHRCRAPADHHRDEVAERAEQDLQHAADQGGGDQLPGEATETVG